MTHTELALLLSGIAIGFDLAVAMHFGYQVLDARRERRRREAAQDHLRGGAEMVELLFCHSTACRGHEGPPFCEPSFTDTYADPAIVGETK